MHPAFRMSNTTTASILPPSHNILPKDSSSEKLTESIISLRGYLDHKVNRTLPPEGHRTFILDFLIEIDLRFIESHRLFPTLGDDEFKAKFRELRETVKAFEHEFYFPAEQRDELVLLITDLFKGEGFRERAGVDWDPPQLESELRQEEAQKSGSKSSKTRIWGKVGAFLLRGS